MDIFKSELVSFLKSTALGLGAAVFTYTLAIHFPLLTSMVIAAGVITKATLKQDDLIDSEEK